MADTKKTAVPTLSEAFSNTSFETIGLTAITCFVMWLLTRGTAEISCGDLTMGVGVTRIVAGLLLIVSIAGAGLYNMYFNKNDPEKVIGYAMYATVGILILYFLASCMFDLSLGNTKLGMVELAGGLGSIALGGYVYYKNPKIRM